MKKIVFIFGCANLLTACQTAAPPSPRPPTPQIESRRAATERFTIGVVQSQIKKGVTSKGEVLVILGTPNMVTTNKEGKELHIWDNRSTESERASGGGAEVLIQSERSITVAITYSSNELVEEVTYRATSF